MQVKFEMNQETWDVVISCSKENMEIVSETQDYFIVKYDTCTDFFMALERFEGMIEYREI